MNLTGKTRQQRRPGDTARRRRCGALNLVEVVVAMAILGIGIVAIYSALLSSLRVSKLSRENLRATQVMVELMDTLRLYSWDQITDPTFTPKKFEIEYDPVGATNGGSSPFVYKCQMNVRKGPNDVTYRDKMKTVTLNIEWRNDSQDKRSRTFVTYVTRNGLQSYIYY